MLRPARRCGRQPRGPGPGTSRYRRAGRPPGPARRIGDRGLGGFQDVVGVVHPAGGPRRGCRLAGPPPGPRHRRRRLPAIDQGGQGFLVAALWLRASARAMAAPGALSGQGGGRPAGRTSSQSCCSAARWLAASSSSGSSSPPDVEPPGHHPQRDRARAGRRLRRPRPGRRADRGRAPPAGRPGSPPRRPDEQAGRAPPPATYSTARRPWRWSDETEVPGARRVRMPRGTGSPKATSSRVAISLRPNRASRSWTSSVRRGPAVRAPAGATRRGGAAIVPVVCPDDTSSRRYNGLPRLSPPERLAQIAVQLGRPGSWPARATVSSRPRGWRSSRSSSPSFQSARTPSGMGLPARTVTTAAALPADTSWNTRVADASSRRWASSTTSTSLRASGPGEDRPPQALEQVEAVLVERVCPRRPPAPAEQTPRTV